MSHVIEQRVAGTLGSLGLLPFFALAVAWWLPLAPPQARALELGLVAYAAVIVTFVGAVHWGLALATPELDKQQAWQALGWSVAPSLLGWCGLMLAFVGLSPAIVVAILLADLWLCRLADSVLLPLYPRAPRWFAPLRTRLTIGASLALAIALVAAL